MARGQTNANPVKGGIRRRRNKMPTMSGNGDTSVVKYATLGNDTGTINGLGRGVYYRTYIPGSGANLTNASGPAIVSYYSTGKFLPGTSIRWEPSVSFTTPGRVYVAFTDNPEHIQTALTAYTAFINAQTVANYNAYAAIVKGMGSLRSFPVWQETDVPFPTRLRRKRFDVNVTGGASSVDAADRSVQTAMFCCIDAGPAADTLMGSFHFHDVLDVEGITGMTS